MPSIVDSSGAEKPASSNRGRLRLSPKEVARFRGALMLAMDRRGWSLRQLGAIFGAAASTIADDLKAIPAEAATRFDKLAGGLTDALPTPEQMEAFVRSYARAKARKKKPRGRGRWGDGVASLSVRVPHRANPSPQSRRLAAEAAIDARCLEVLAGCRGDVPKAAKALGITPARVRAAVVRKLGES